MLVLSMPPPADYRKIITSLMLLTGLTGFPHSVSADVTRDEQPARFGQIMFGQLDTHQQQTITQGQSDPGITEEFPDNLPYAGGNVQIPLNHGDLQFGWESGAFLSLDADITRFFAASDEQGGRAIVEFDNKLLLFETYMGLFISETWRNRVRVYVSAGPMIVYGVVDVDNAEHAPNSDGFIVTSDNSEIHLYEETDGAIDVGYYGRSGIDVKVDDRFWIGFSVRYVDSELDFTKTFGKLEVKGTQYLLTISFEL